MKDFSMDCPVPCQTQDAITMAHGGGGRAMQRLLERMVFPAFENGLSRERHDGVILPVQGARIAFTTDSFVVHPLFFPGGDIGSLAVNGTVNDLAMCGARPLYLSSAFILEEGFPTADLKRVVRSMAAAAAAASVSLVTGDTKVVERSHGDGVFVNTSGVGVLDHGLPIFPSSVRPGDAVILSGDIGRHGIAILALREGLRFDSEIKSDTAPLSRLVSDILQSGAKVHCLRDATRGGVASALNEIAEKAGLCIRIDERNIPVRDDIRGACEILGLDPLYVANEGRFLAFVPSEDAEKTVSILRSHPSGAGAAVIGEVTDSRQGVPVVLKCQIGTERVLDMLSGEQLPRIC